MKKNVTKFALILAISLMPLASNAANWSGFYIGGVVALGMPTTIVDDYNCNITCTSWNENSHMGMTYGIDAGYNWNLSPAVLAGVEFDYSGTSFKGSAYSADWGANGAGHDSEWNALVTLRGRAGVLVDNAYLYATGGLAAVDLDASGFNVGCTSCAYSTSDYRYGLAVGAGLEIKPGNGHWSYKGEVLSVSTQGKETLATTTTQDYNKYKVTASALLFRFGANYNF